MLKSIPVCIQLHYVIGSQGEPIVLLHGWPQTWYEWRHVIPALAKNYTIIAPDLRGLGDSSKPVTGYDGKTTAEDIYQLISQLGFKDIFSVGHDFGVQVPYSYAAAHPDEVRRLVILDVPIPGIGPGEILQAYGGLNFIWYGIFQKCLLTDTKGSTLLGSIGTHVILLPSLKTILTNMLTTILVLVLFDNIKQNKECSTVIFPMPVLVLGGECSFGTAALDSMRLLATDVRGGVVPDSTLDFRTAADFVIEQLVNFFSNGAKATE